MKRLVSISLFCAIALSVLAVPARQTGYLRVAADGTEKMVYQYGDESFHYMTDAEGNWLDETTLMPLTAEQKAVRQQAGETQRQIRRAHQGTGTDRLLARRGAVILVSYKDKAFANSFEGMYNWAMGENYTYGGATGSINRYFNDVSGNRYNMWIDVFGPVTVSKDLNYYGENNSQGSDKHPDELVVEACKLASTQCGANFANYDSNNDGKVDWVVIIYAGKGEADGGASNTIWPHQSDLSYSGKAFLLNGKTVDHYCCLNEVDGQTNKRCGIGTFCHEFSHIMGLPDLYATTQSARHKTCGSWDIMDHGCYNNGGNTPPAYSAYERWFMGWLEPKLLNEPSATVSLPELNEFYDAAYITDDGSAVNDILYPIPSSFYILENRQQKGWDKYLPGHGMLVTRINYNSSRWAGNTVNNVASSMGIDIIEADGLAPSGNLGKPGDLYPTGSTEFTRSLNYQITNIAEENEIITFDVNGGGEMILLDINNVKHDTPAKKIIRNGRVVIIRGDKEYDILGNENHQL